MGLLIATWREGIIWRLICESIHAQYHKTCCISFDIWRENVLMVLTAPYPLYSPRPLTPHNVKNHKTHYAPISIRSAQYSKASLSFLSSATAVHFFCSFNATWLSNFCIRFANASVSKFGALVIFPLFIFSSSFSFSTLFLWNLGFLNFREDLCKLLR